MKRTIHFFRELEATASGGGAGIGLMLLLLCLYQAAGGSISRLPWLLNRASDLVSAAGPPTITRLMAMYFAGCFLLLLPGGVIGAVLYRRSGDQPWYRSVAQVQRTLWLVGILCTFWQFARLLL